jgi:hypothetical protein
MDTNGLIASATATLLVVAWRVAGALVLWLAGRWFISLSVKMLSRALRGERFDPTLSRYLERGLSVLLNAVLIVDSRHLLFTPAPAITMGTSAPPS